MNPDSQESALQTLPPTTPARACVRVCVSCGQSATEALGEISSGWRLYNDLLRVAAKLADIEVHAVECFAVCDRPVTLAFQAPGKWSYLIGDVDVGRDLEDILAAAAAVAASPHGVPPLTERPPFFRRGVIGRLPPL